MKKGFTLIELLAVIVILAIIALIATPIVLNIVKDSKENSAARSLEGYVKGVDNAQAQYMLLNNGEMARNLNDLTISVDNADKLEEINVEFKKDGTVAVAQANIGEYHCNYGIKGTKCYLIDNYNYIAQVRTNAMREQIALDNGVTIECLNQGPACYEIYDSLRATIQEEYDDIFFNTSVSTSSLETITFTDEEIENYDHNYDISKDNDGSVMLYLDGSDAYIYSDKAIMLPVNASGFFAGLTNITSIDFNKYRFQ